MNIYIYIYKGNSGSEKEAGHHRHHREEKTQIVWPCQRMPKETILTLIMNAIPREKRKRGCPRNIWM